MALSFLTIECEIFLYVPQKKDLMKKLFKELRISGKFVRKNKLIFMLGLFSISGCTKDPALNNAEMISSIDSPSRVKHLLEEGVSPNLTDSEGRSLVMLAILKNPNNQSYANAVVKTLVAAGADVKYSASEINSTKLNCLWVASRAGFVDVYEFLRGAGAVVDSEAKRAGDDAVAQMKAYVNRCNIITMSYDDAVKIKAGKKEKFGNCTPEAGYLRIGGSTDTGAIAQKIENECYTDGVKRKVGYKVQVYQPGSKFEKPVAVAVAENGCSWQIREHDKTDSKIMKQASYLIDLMVVRPKKISSNAIAEVPTNRKQNKLTKPTGKGAYCKVFVTGVGMCEYKNLRDCTAELHDPDDTCNPRKSGELQDTSNNITSEPKKKKGSRHIVFTNSVGGKAYCVVYENGEGTCNFDSLEDCEKDYLKTSQTGTKCLPLASKTNLKNGSQMDGTK